MRNSTLAKSIERLKSNTASNEEEKEDGFDILDGEEFYEEVSDT